MATVKDILKTLERCNGYCLDNHTERGLVANEIFADFFSEKPYTGYKCFSCGRQGKDLTLVVSCYTSITIDGSEVEKGERGEANNPVQYDGKDNATCNDCGAEGELRCFDASSPSFKMDEN